MKIKYRTTWRNTIKKEVTQPLKYFLPETLQDIQNIIREAEPQGIRVRAVGSGHSFSDVAITHGYLVDLKKLNTVVPRFHSEWLKNNNNNCLVNAEAGVTIQKFNKLAAKEGLCVTNMGGIDNQTLAGAISTGTHGTGIDLQAFHGMVRSMVLVTGNGKTYRIEPADNGITDPAKYNEPGIELRQDDDLFNTVLVGLGCCGIIYSLIMELEPMFWMEENKKLEKWSGIRSKISDGTIFEKDDNGNNIYRGIMVMVSPYFDKKINDHLAIVVRHKRLPEKPKRGLNALTRNMLYRLGAFPLIYWYASFTVKYRPKSIEGLINSSLRSLPDKIYDNKGYKVMYQGVEYVKKRAYDCEFAFDMDLHDPMKALDEIMNKAKDLKNNDKIYQSGPFGIRFVRGSTAFLCPDYDKKRVCYIDMPSLKNTIGLDEMLNQYQDIILKHKEGIPHWGKIHNRVFRYPGLIKAAYPELNRWLEVIRLFDPKETFSNDFFYRLASI